MTYKIGMFTEEGIRTLEYFDSYSEAELAFDDYCDLYPNAHLEILNENYDEL